jgi:hypothetical protein
VEADLKYARYAAEAASASRTVVFNQPASTYAIGLVAHLNHFSGPYTVSLADHGAGIKSVDFGGDASVTFDGYGRPDSGGFVRVGSGETDWQVTLDSATGAVSVQRAP